jgi:hypothetical protein
MIDSLAVAFETFDQRIRLSHTQRQAAAKRTNAVSRLLTSDPSILKCVAVGSLVRSTAIRRFSDVDILAVVKPAGNGQADSTSLLELVARICRGVAENVTVDRNAVSLTYSRWPRADIIPAFVTDEGRQDDPTFRIPDGNRRAWLSYSPEAQNRLLANRLQQLGPRLKSTIRMIKWWSHLNGRPVRSSEVEALACHLFVDNIPDYPRAICSILDAAADWENGAQSGYDLDQSTGNRKTMTACDRVEEGRILARQALEIGDHGPFAQQEAGVLWRRLFGERFPSVVR